MARPLKEINKRTFENLCGLQCTKAEVCAALDVTEKTLESWCKRTYKAGFSQVFKEKRGKGQISLRRAQFRLAEKNASMAIFLGKNYLGQTDVVQQHVSVVTDETRAQVRSLIEEAEEADAEKEDEQ